MAPTWQELGGSVPGNISCKPERLASQNEGSPPSLFSQKGSHPSWSSWGQLSWFDKVSLMPQQYTTYLCACHLATNSTAARKVKWQSKTQGEKKENLLPRSVNGNCPRSIKRNVLINRTVSSNWNQRVPSKLLALQQVQQPKIGRQGIIVVYMLLGFTNKQHGPKNIKIGSNISPEQFLKSFFGLVARRLI